MVLLLMVPLPNSNLSSSNLPTLPTNPRRPNNNLPLVSRSSSSCNLLLSNNSNRALIQLTPNNPNHLPSKIKLPNQLSRSLLLALHPLIRRMTRCRGHD